MNKLTAVLGLLFAFSLEAAALKVGVIEMQRALQTVNRGKTAMKRLEEQLGKEKTELDKQQTSLQKEMQEFQRKSSKLSEEAKSTQGMALQKKMSEFQLKAQKFQMDVQTKQAEAAKPIIEGLQELIPRLSDKHKLALVMDSTSSGLLFAKEKIDLTEELIKSYNEKNP